MKTILIVGIGTGNPEHLTVQAINALNRADLLFIPDKGAGKADLADLRRDIVARYVTNPASRMVTYGVPRRDVAIPITAPASMPGTPRWPRFSASCWPRSPRTAPELSWSGAIRASTIRPSASSSACAPTMRSKSFPAYRRSRRSPPPTASR